MRAKESKWMQGIECHVAERSFNPGDLVSFQFPRGAYGPKSQQALENGKHGYVVSVWNDSRCQVYFGRGIPITVNTAYLRRNS